MTTRQQPRISALFAIGLLVVCGMACSLLRPKRPLTWHLTLEVVAPAAGRADATKQTITVIERRLNALGVSNFEVKPEGDLANGRIRVNLPAMPDRDRLAQLIRDEGKLELTAVIGPPNPAPAQTFATREEAIASLNSGGTIPENRRVLPYVVVEIDGPLSKKWVVFESPAIVDGSDLRDARAASSGGDNYEIQFSLNQTGAGKFGAWTGSHINQYLGVVLNDEVKSIAYIKSQITDQGVITGRFTKQSAEDLALVLKSGALPARVMVVEETNDK